MYRQRERTVRDRNNLKDRLRDGLEEREIKRAHLAIEQDRAIKSEV